MQFCVNKVSVNIDHVKCILYGQLDRKFLFEPTSPEIDEKTVR